ncbi:MAG: glycosyltransferase family 2 protein [Mycoplasma sp.]|nr:glycosyltransferase family 2 protein [Mycoplasma sp.]
MKVLIIIPAHNEEESIVKTIENIKKHTPQMDYLVINDGSSDRTKYILRNNNINHISHPINLGLSSTIQTGFLYAYRNNYDCVVQIDGDNQHNPKDIHYMIMTMKEHNLNLVQGSRFVEKKKNWSLRMLGSRIISFAIFLTTFKRISDPTNGMRLFDRNLIKEFALKMNRVPEPDTISFLLKEKYKIKEVQVEVKERESGQSYLTTFSSMKYMIHVIISILLIQPFRKKEHKKELKKLKRLEKRGVRNANSN